MSFKIDLVSFKNQPGGPQGQFKYILSIIELFSKMAVLVALCSKTGRSAACQLVPCQAVWR